MAFTNGDTTIWPGGDIDLLCGTDDTSGFKHIRYRHQYGTAVHPNGWEDVRDAVSDALGYTTPYTWDDFMIHAVEDTLDYPDPIPVEQTENQATCFSAPFRIFSGDEIYASWYANTVVGYNTFNLVTAFLSDSSSVSQCDEDD